MRLRTDKADQRRREAQQRNAIWAQMSTADKIASLTSRRGESKRQLERLGK